MTYSAIIFDCDGVLVESESLAVRLESNLLTAAGFPLSFDDIAANYVGLSYQAMADGIEDRFGTPIPEGLMDEVQELIVNTIAEGLAPVEGMEQLLGASGLPRCVASSSRLKRVRLSLDVAGLSKYFDPDLVLSAQMVEHAKPAPDLFFLAAAKLGVEPEQCLVIEDSPSGVSAGLAAGMDVVAFTAGEHCRPGLQQRLADAGATYHASTIDELADWVVDPTF